MAELDVAGGKVSGAVYTDENKKQSDLLSKVFNKSQFLNLETEKLF